MGTLRPATSTLALKTQTMWPTASLTGVQVDALRQPLENRAAMASDVAASTGTTSQAQRLVSNARYLNRRSEALLATRSKKNLNRSLSPPLPDAYVTTMAEASLPERRAPLSSRNAQPLRIRSTRASKLRQRAAPVSSQPDSRSGEKLGRHSTPTSVHYDVATVTMPSGTTTADAEHHRKAGSSRARRSSMRASSERLSALSAMGTTAQSLNQSFKSGVGKIPNVVVHDIFEGYRFRLWDLFSHTLLVLDFYLAMGSARATFPLVSVDA